MMGKHLKFHDHLLNDACDEDCPLPHLTEEEARLLVPEVVEVRTTDYTPCFYCNGDTPNLVGLISSEIPGNIFCSLGCLYYHIERFLRVN